MPRKAFLADLQATTATKLPDGVSNLKQADDDGAFTLDIRPLKKEDNIITLQVNVDVDEYPNLHNNFVFVVTDGAPTCVEQAIADHSQFEGLRVTQLVSKIARLVHVATSGSQGNPLNLDSDGDGEFIDLDDLLTDSSDRDDDEFEDAIFGNSQSLPSMQSASGSAADPQKTTDSRENELSIRARNDFAALKHAGFHVSTHGSRPSMAGHLYLTISCRVAKLNISEDALRAWNVLPEHYFLLVVHYKNGYRSFDQIRKYAEDTRYAANSCIEFRTAVSTNRKATRTDIIDLFTQGGPVQVSETIPQKEGEKIRNCSLQKFFMDRPLDEVLNKRLLPVLNARIAYCLGWCAAEQLIQDQEDAMRDQSMASDEGFWHREDKSWGTMPMLRIGDHLAVYQPHKSFPLIAMEFALHRFIRCTEYCLICHVQMDAGFEALKPYVCSKPLCLYQYMALGFGPSMEHEILSQPYVVDLLTSFCYARAYRGSLSDLPVGMGLDVPDPQALHISREPLVPPQGRWWNSATKQNNTADAVKTPTNPSTSFPVRHNLEDEELQLEDGLKPIVKKGDWLLLRYLDGSAAGLPPFQLCKISEVCLPTIRLKKPASASLTPEAPFKRVSTHQSSPKESARPATAFPFDTKFDSLQSDAQQHAICLLLEALPAVQDMKAALAADNSKSMVSQHFPDTPATAFHILRWIIASNRSCIISVDDPISMTTNSKERVHGMSGYMQFRFAQGAPDKEQRFIREVRNAQAKTKNEHPTIWAWHGSPLHNWHSIIREGLHFKEMVNGRAFGDGVYHSMQATTSSGYTNHYPISGVNPILHPKWRKSALNVTSALSLNEIVNDPKKFRCLSPHLVVQHVDWIQTRYLFVQVSLPSSQQKFLQDVSGSIPPGEALPQDKQWLPMGMKGSSIILPAGAVSPSRLQAMDSQLHDRQLSKRTKKSGQAGGSKNDAEDILLLSDATDDEDLALLGDPNGKLVIDLTDDTPKASPSLGSTVLAKFSGWSEKQRRSAPPKAEPQTDFKPGSLNLSTLPMLPPPPYATTSANRALARELKALQKTQSSTHPAELGWYLCEGALDNMYQWIVELHSFESSLPLSKDLKSKKLTSVVLELRFGPQFPFSPPFVRVIRPRFLDFRSGGGGHVTAGGAMCMELLTNNGWSAVSSIESVLLQVRMAISSTDPHPARLPSGAVGEYSAGEAIEAYKRACMLHGWSIPPDFQHIEQQSR